MRIIFFIPLFILITPNIFSQNEIALARYVIVRATEDCEDISDILIEERAYIAFYAVDSEKNLFMGNHWSKAKSESYGPIEITRIDNLHNESKSDTIQVVFFDWHYKNSYDDQQGTAKAKIVLYDEIFSLRIITEDLKVLVYDGYKEGEVDFSEFYQTKDD